MIKDEKLGIYFLVVIVVVYCEGGPLWEILSWYRRTR